MCKIGDIILVYNAKNKKPIGKHPFIVVNDQGGKICGMYAYDFMGILLSSADTPEKKTKLTRFAGNFPIASNDKDMKKGWSNSNKDSYAKADQLFYFDKAKTTYIEIGQLNFEIYELLREFMEDLIRRGIPIIQIPDLARKVEPEPKTANFEVAATKEAEDFAKEIADLTTAEKEEEKKKAKTDLSIN